MLLKCRFPRRLPCMGLLGVRKTAQSWLGLAIVALRIRANLGVSESVDVSFLLARRPVNGAPLCLRPLEAETNFVLLGLLAKTNCVLSRLG